jgi:hypothetical protein
MKCTSSKLLFNTNSVIELVSIYFNVLTEEKLPFNIQDTNEISKACWFSLPEILNISKNQMNYGLKSWINNMTDGNFISSEYRIPKFINNAN